MSEILKAIISFGYAVLNKRSLEYNAIVVPIHVYLSNPTKLTHNIPSLTIQ